MVQKQPRFRIAEIFGPTIQGEGRRAGTPCFFIRFAGCDSRCVWCDSPHAVLPQYVNQTPRKTTEEIMNELGALNAGPEWVVFSGGNPALFDLQDLVDLCYSELGLKCMVETQGTVWKEWMEDVDDLCVSPKPPSSHNMLDREGLHEFLVQTAAMSTPPYLKIVVFDDNDYLYARMTHYYFPQFEMFLSVGNEDPTLPTVGNPEPDPSVTMYSPQSTQDVVLEKTRWLMERVAQDPQMSDVRVLPQLHVLAWGNERGR
jgi:7-carboxy-7-deazaguanine synthase